MARETHSYAWAGLLEAADVPVDALSANARRGLEFAQTLAWDALERSACKYDWNRRKSLTVAQLARTDRLPESTVRRWIANARYELFGTIGESAIYKRLARDPDLEPATARGCRELGCPNVLPLHAHRNRDYCNEHRGPAARTRRHRQLQSANNTIA